MVAMLTVQVIIYFELLISLTLQKEFLAALPAPYPVPKTAPDPVHTTMQENNTRTDSLIHAFTLALNLPVRVFF